MYYIFTCIGGYKHRYSHSVLSSYTKEIEDLGMRELTSNGGGGGGDCRSRMLN